MSIPFHFVLLQISKHSLCLSAGSRPQWAVLTHLLDEIIKDQSKSKGTDFYQMKYSTFCLLMILKGLQLQSQSKIK